MAWPEQFSACGIQLVRLNAEYLALVHQWRQHPDVARYMRQQGEITWDTHCAWFENLAVREDKRGYVALYKQQPFAYASVDALLESQSTNVITLQNASRMETGVYIAPDSAYRGTVMAFAPALAMNTLIFEQNPDCIIEACVREDNHAAIRFNTTLGYQTCEPHVISTGASEGFITMQLTRDAFAKASQQLAKILRF